jgi:hypothetical protein
MPPKRPQVSFGGGWIWGSFSSRKKPPAPLSVSFFTIFPTTTTLPAGVSELTRTGRVAGRGMRFPALTPTADKIKTTFPE